METEDGTWAIESKTTQAMEVTREPTPWRHSIQRKDPNPGNLILLILYPRNCGPAQNPLRERNVLRRDPENLG